MFARAEGGIRGVVAAMAVVAGKRRQIAHAFLEEGRPLRCSLRIPTSHLSPADLLVIEHTLVEFRKALEDPAAYTRTEG